MLRAMLRTAWILCAAAAAAPLLLTEAARAEDALPPPSVSAPGMAAAPDGVVAQAPAFDDLGDVPNVAPVGLSDMLVPMARTMLALLLVVGLAYLTLHKGLGKLVANSQSGKRVKVVERISLDQRRALYLVEVDGKEILLAGGEGGVTRLLDTERPPASAAAQPAGVVSLGSRFTAALSRQRPAGAPVSGPQAATAAAAAKEDA